MTKQAQRGFSLIEVVIGLIALMSAFAIILSVLMPQAERSVDPMFQVRAAELGQALIEEINSQAFDHNSIGNSDNARCGELGLGALACTTINTCPTGNAELGEVRETFNDVDDYHCLSESGQNIKAGDGTELAIYQGFQVAVIVGYDGNMDGVTSTTPEAAKLIKVTVTTPSGEGIVFSTYRFNY